MLNLYNQERTCSRFISSLELVFKGFSTMPTALKTGLATLLLVSGFYGPSAYGQCGPGEDKTPPTVSCTNLLITAQLNATGVFPITPSAYVTSSNDICGSPTLIANPSQFTCNTLGFQTVQITAVDQAGNSSAPCSVNFLVEDKSPPILTCPPNSTITCGQSYGQTLPLASDACGLNGLPQSNFPGVQVPGSSSVCYDIQLTWTVEDVNGNIGSCVQIITVDDNVNPYFDWNGNDPGNGTGPANMTLSCEDPLPSAVCCVVIDDCPNPTLTTNDVVVGKSNDPSKCEYYNYTVERTYTGKDACGNTTVPHKQVFKIEDKKAPVITANATVLNFTADANCKYVIQAGKELKVSVSDNCAAAQFLTTSFEVVDDDTGKKINSGSGLDAGSTYPAGNYTVLYSASDPCGNIGFFSIDLTIADQTPPTAICHSAVTVSGNLTIPPAVINNGSFDNCGSIKTMTVSPSMLPCPQKTCDGVPGFSYTQQVELTVSDGFNTAKCTSLVTVTDKGEPSAFCQNITRNLDGIGNVTVAATEINNGSTDNCGIFSLEISKNGGTNYFPSVTFGCAEVGDRNVLLKVTDCYGNTKTCSAVVKVVDNLNPNPVCNNLSIVLNQDGMYTLTAGNLTSLTSGSTDNCSYTVTSSKNTFSCADVGPNGVDVTLTLKDPSNNTATCARKIFVSDNMAPMITCTNITANLNANGKATVTGSMLASGGIYLSSGDNASNTAGSNKFCVTVTKPTTLSFSYDYATQDVSPFRDPFGYTVNNGAFQPIYPASTAACTATGGNLSNPGTVSVNLIANQTFCFEVKTCTNNAAKSEIWVKNFNQAFTGDFAPNKWTQTNTNSNGKAFFYDACSPVTFEISLDNVSFNPSVMFDCDDVKSPVPVFIRAKDVYGNPSTVLSGCSVTIQDKQAPQAQCDEVVVSLNGDGEATVPAIDFDQGSIDACDGTKLGFKVSTDGGTTFLDDLKLGCSDVGTKAVILQVTDQSGNSAYCPTQVVVNDNLAPFFTLCPEDITVACGTSTAPATTGIAEAEDNCVGVVTPTFTDLAPLPVVNHINGFNGAYDAANWTVSKGGSVSSSVDVSGQPFTIVMKSSNTGSPASNVTSLSIIVPATGTISFNWGYSTANGSASLDPFGYSINGVFTKLTNDGGPLVQSGSISIPVTAGNIFAFEARSIDQCCGAGTTTISAFSGPASFNNADCQIIRRRWMATDGKNTNFCFQNITVEDKKAPTYTGNFAPVSVECKTPAVVTPSFSDNCDALLTITLDTVDSRINYAAMPPVYIYTPDQADYYNYYVDRTWTAIDNCGNATSVTRRYNVEDTQGPEFNHPDMVMFNSTPGQCAGTANLNLTNFISDCAAFKYLDIGYTVDNNPVFYSGANASGTYTVGEHTIYFIATDPSGNSTFFVLTVVIKDTESPSPQCENITRTLTNTGIVSIDPADIDKGKSDDNCGIVKLTLDKSTFDCSNVGPNTIKLTAEDAAGNKNSCTAIVTIQLPSTPTITCPAPKTVECSESLLPANTGTPVVVLSINCGNASAFTYTDVTIPGGQTNCRTIERTFSIGTATCKQTITVKDSNPPVLVGVPNYPNPAQACKVDPPATVTATDSGCGTPAVSYSETSTQNPDPSLCGHYQYTLTRTWTTTDNCNSAVSAKRTLEVIDNTAPAINIPNPLVISTDLNKCDANVNVNLLDYISDCTPDQYLVVTNNASTLYGKGNGVNNINGIYATGTYPITVTAKDVCGNMTAPYTFNLVIQDGQNPVAKCFTKVTLALDNTGNAILNVVDVNDNSYDNCGIVSYELSKTSFTTANIGLNAVTLTVKDAAGKANSCTSEVTVVDDPAFTVGSVVGTQGSMVNIPITVKQFTDITNFKIKIDIANGSVAQIQSIVDIHPSLVGLISTVTPASVTVNWTHNVNPSPGVDLAPDAVIFKVKVNLVGGNGTSTPINIDDAALSVTQLIASIPTAVMAVGIDGVIQISNVTTSYTVSGNIIEQPACGSDPILQVNVAYSGSVSGVLPNVPGTYSLTVPGGSNVTVTPSKNINFANNISTFDAYMAHLYSVGMTPPAPLAPLTPLQIVAADANSNNTVTAQDAYLIHQLAAGYAVVLPKSWRFIPKSQALALPVDPFTPGFSESVTYNNISANQLLQDFIGLKVGDVVGCDANPANFDPGAAADRGDDLLKFRLEDRAITAGEEVELTFKAQDFNGILTCQYTLSFDPAMLQLETAVPGELTNLTNACFNNLKAAQGMMAFAWYNLNPVSMPDGSVLFTLKFKALQNTASLKGLLAVSDNFVGIEAVREDGANLDVDLDIEGLTAAGEVSNTGFGLYQNVPNPFGHRTVIGFSLPKRSTAALSIFDPSGKVLMTMDGEYSAGYHQVLIDRNELPAKGVLFYRLETPTHNAVKKMILMD